MRIACLQFAPQLGRVQENIDRANDLLEAILPNSLDLLVLSELAFTGYNFPSLAAIKPYLEPTAAGPTTKWATSTALRLHCLVSVGYPELFSTCPPSTSTTTPPKPTMTPFLPSPSLTAFNSTVTVSPTGEVLAHYRKTHLYYTDESWAQESPTGWLTLPLPLPLPLPPSSPTAADDSSSKGHRPQTTRTTFGICMDLNPYQFRLDAPAYEFAQTAREHQCQCLVLSTAWLTHASTATLAAEPQRPDLKTLGSWLELLQPLVDDPAGEVITVFANRCGEEPGKMFYTDVEDTGVRYAGTSWIGRIGKGRIRVGGIMGAWEEGVVVVDTEEEMAWEVRTRSEDE
ncbi:MAG: hypothetical protein Q9167_003290 [Letrouitia subvulpina]